MTGIRITARPDLETVKGQLDAASLPSSDLEASSMDRFYAGWVDGAMMGVVGLESYGRDGLLRSLAIEPDARGKGLGRALVGEVERRAVGFGIETLYLLTDTAGAFFGRLGYRDCARDAAPSGIRGSREFSTLCPADAAFMCKRLIPMD